MGSQVTVSPALCLREQGAPAAAFADFCSELPCPGGRASEGRGQAYRLTHLLASKDWVMLGQMIEMLKDRNS